MLRAIDNFTRRRSSRTSHEQEDHLCSSCEAHDVRSLLKYGADKRQNSMSAVLSLGDVKSQKKSCGLCSLMYDGAEAVLDSNQEHYVDRKIQSLRLRSHAKHQLKISVSGMYRLQLDLKGRKGTDEYSREEFTEDFYLQELPPGLLAEDESNRLIDERPIDFSQVKRWLNTCHHDHGDECDPATKYGFVRRPKRLTVIDVVDKCLVELPELAPYAALSYVWGGVQLVHLNSSNKNDLWKINGLLGSQFAGGLPNTIWDAIDVTKEIEIRYLWVDSLCIQQDDPEETRHQVAHMHNIFGSAYVTLIAAQGDSARSGLLGTSFRPREVRYGLQIVEDEDEEAISQLLMPGMFLGVVAVNHKGKPDPESWDITSKAALPEATLVANTVWNSRAWTYQEWQLSSRALVFLDNQVFWHCNQAVYSEHLLGRKTNNRGHAIDKRYTRIGNLTSNPHFKASWKQHDASIEVRRDGRTLVVSSEAFLLYKDLVTAYTPRNIGKIHDKLAAFDGIGKVLERCLDSNLLYGLPETLLDPALLWQPKAHVIKVKGPGFPSWSWAGWKGAIGYIEQHGVSQGAKRELYDDESRPERVRPLVRWYKSTAEGRFEPVNGFGIGIKEALIDDEFPDGWTGVLAESQSRNIDIDDESHSESLIRCYTMVQSLPVQHGYIYSADGASNVIGDFTWDDEEHPTATPNGPRVKVQLITLSETQFFRSEELNTKLRGNLYNEPHEYSLYNVMAVEWSADASTAYRRGLGRVFQDEWDKSQPEYRWVNLG